MWHGYGANGAMGTGAVANLSVFTKVNTPETGAEVKYINAGLINTSLVLKDNTVWESGYNGSGEIGNGTTSDCLNFVQGETSEGALNEVLTVGKNLRKYKRRTYIKHSSYSKKWKHIYSTEITHFHK